MDFYYENELLVRTNKVKEEMEDNFWAFFDADEDWPFWADVNGKRVPFTYYRCRRFRGELLFESEFERDGEYVRRYSNEWYNVDFVYPIERRILFEFFSMDVTPKDEEHPNIYAKIVPDDGQKGLVYIGDEDYYNLYMARDEDADACETLCWMNDLVREMFPGYHITEKKIF